MPQPGSRATLVFMHPLGGSAESWKPVEERLGGQVPCIRLDLPGFGDLAAEDGLPVGGMADRVEQQVAARVDGPWVLVGHSMSAKVALLIARRAQDGRHALRDLAGLVLAAGSPPAPEPMEQNKREEMMGWFNGDEARSQKEADGFVRNNVSASLTAALHESAVRDVLRGSRQAWTAWLRDGSLEDLRETVGVLSIPTLVLAGAEDEALGEAAQREHMLPHVPSARLEVVEGAAHLLPMEQPEQVAGLIAAFVAKLAPHPPASSAAEARMTARTRALLRERGEPDAGYEPAVLDRDGLAVLRRLLRAVLPMPDGIEIDLAAKLDARLAENTGDGWRFAALPPDRDCYRQAVATLEEMARRRHDTGFAALNDAACVAMLHGIGAGEPDPDSSPLSAEPMRFWLQEVRGDACQIFLTHPAVQQRANILAAATGDDRTLRGFERIGAGESERWEDAAWREPA